MTRFTAVLSFALTLLMFSISTAVSAASGSELGQVSQAAALQSLRKDVQYGGGGYSDPKSLRRDYDDADDDEVDYDDNQYDRPRYRRFDDRHDYCFNCARRCSDGWCPPRCWDWRRYCRRDRY